MQRPPTIIAAQFSLVFGENREHGREDGRTVEQTIRRTTMRGLDYRARLSELSFHPCRKRQLASAAGVLLLSQQPNATYFLRDERRLPIHH